MKTGLSLLVVDDSPEFANALAERLATCWDVSHRRAATADEFRTALGERGWQLVLCSHRTAQFGATAALRIALELGADAPILILSSGAVSAEEASAAMKLGASAFVSRDDLGPLIAVVADELRDAEKRRTEHQEDKAVRASGSFARAIVESLSEPLITFDPTGHIESFNPAAERLFQRRREDTLGKHVGMLFERPLVELVGRGPQPITAHGPSGTLPLKVTVSDTSIAGRQVFIAVARPRE